MESYAPAACRLDATWAHYSCSCRQTKSKHSIAVDGRNLLLRTPFRRSWQVDISRPRPLVRMSEEVRWGVVSHGHRRWAADKRGGSDRRRKTAARRRRQRSAGWLSSRCSRRADCGWSPGVLHDLLPGQSVALPGSNPGPWSALRSPGHHKTSVNCNVLLFNNTVHCNIIIMFQCPVIRTRLTQYYYNNTVTI